MKKQFEVGQRVAVYDYAFREFEGSRGVGRVINSTGDGAFVHWVNVKLLNGRVETYHPKQLRRLIPKPRRRWTGRWVAFEGGYYFWPESMSSEEGELLRAQGTVGLTEVRKGKK